MFRTKILRRNRRKTYLFHSRWRARPLQHGRPADAIAYFSHELRTPVHGLSGTLELLASSGLTGHQRQLVEAMRRCSQSLTAMLDGAIAIPGHAKAQSTANITRFDLVSQIEDSISMFMGWAGAQSVELAYSISADTPAFISADRRVLVQVVNNLLSNAIKYCSGSTVMIRLSFIHGESSMLHVCVSDNGAGIQPGKEQDICEPPSQVRHPATENYSSSGLGLNICRALVKAAGGRMKISANIGSGTLCSFSFPIVSTDDSNSIETAPSKLLQQCGVLVIAADEICESVCCHLQRWGIRFLQISSVDRLEDLELPAATIDMLILDFPSVHGRSGDVMEKIRQRWPTAPVSVLMPFARETDHGVEDPWVNVLSKPLSRSALLAWLLACNIPVSRDIAG